MNSESQTADSLQLFVQDVGIPASIHSDGAKAYTKGRFQDIISRENIRYTCIEPYRHNENRAEISIREIKKRVRRIMQRMNMPLRLWCFATEYVVAIMNLTAADIYRLGGRTPYECVFGYTPDISEYIEFELYEPVWFYDKEHPYPDQPKMLGRWLGVAHKVGQAMCYYILKDNGEIVVRSTVSNVEADDIDQDSFKERLRLLDEGISLKIGNFKAALVDPKEPTDGINDLILWNINDLDEDLDDEFTQIDEADHVIDVEDLPSGNDMELLDKYIGAKILLPFEDQKVLVTVKERAKDDNGKSVGKYNDNPIINSKIYRALMPDGTYQDITANTIIENIYDNSDQQGYQSGYLEDIVGHRKTEDAIPVEEGFVVTKNGQHKPKITTKGWELCVRWRDQTTSWVSLASLKESNPAELAEYAKSNGLQHEPAFAWWINHAIRKKASLIARVRARKKKNIKFGIAVPRTVEEALALDKENGNDLWARAIEKERTNSSVAFQFLGLGTKAPPGFQKITCHMVFDVKFDLTRKARYVAGGHLTEVPESMTYASVVSRDSVRILFTIAALNDLDIRMCDIGNAYLNAKTREKVYIIAGPEWGDKEGETVLIVRALYGLKSSGAEWKRHFADTLRHVLKFTPSLADDNVWMKKCKRPDGSTYYSYILVYVDDVLCISHDPNYYMKILSGEYRLKEEPAEPSMYLGTDVKKWEITDEGGIKLRESWALGSESHVKKAVQVVKQLLMKDNLKFTSSKKVPSHPFSTQGYRPELDCTELCDDGEWQIYMSLIGMARWICEIGRIDILTEISMLSSYSAAPRRGHLHQLLHVFHYLEHHNRSWLVMDHEYANIDISGNDVTESPIENAKVMKELYPDAVEDIPPNMPEALGRSVEINTFVDSDHAGDVVTRRSRTGILIFMNKSPIMWLSQRQATVESSTFGSEFVALRKAIEMVKSLRYKLRMFGVPIEGAALIFGDNDSVVKNSSRPESTLKKKHHSISYHTAREAVAAGIAYIIKVGTGYNLADIFTKILPSEQRKFILSKITN